MNEGHMECRVCHERGPVSFTPGVGYPKHCGETMYGPYPPPPKTCIRKDHDHKRPWWATAGQGHCVFGGVDPWHGYDDDCTVCGDQHDEMIQEGAG